MKFDLSELIGDQKVIAAVLGPNREVCLLLVSTADEDIACGREKNGFASFPLSRATISYPATFIRFDGQLLQRTTIDEVTCAFPNVQPLPNNEALIVGSRCHFRGGDPEKNAAIVDCNGNLVREFVLGDGIQDVQTAKDGSIWVSYFDEGIFGNFGWTERVGSAGLVCFDSEGHSVWDFGKTGTGNPMADCYAMNVTDESVWACYYTDFPVVRIDGKHKVAEWANRVRGAHALAIDSRRIAFCGDYGDQRNRCVVQDFGEGQLVNPKELSLQFPKGMDGAGLRVRGRGNCLYALAGKHWCEWQIE